MDTNAHASELFKLKVVCAESEAATPSLFIRNAQVVCANEAEKDYICGRPVIKQGRHDKRFRLSWHYLYHAEDGVHYALKWEYMG